MYRSFPFSISNQTEYTLKESVVGHLKFLFFSKKKEHRYDVRRGCDIWDYEYKKLSKRRLLEYLIDTLNQEKRLIGASIEEEERGIIYDKKKQLLKFTIIGSVNDDPLRIDLKIPINITIT